MQILSFGLCPNLPALPVICYQVECQLSLPGYYCWFVSHWEQFGKVLESLVLNAAGLYPVGVLRHVNATTASFCRTR